MSQYDTTSQFSTLRTDPIRNFKFLVSLNIKLPANVANNGKWETPSEVGFALGFTSVSGFSATTNPIAYRSGGMNTTPQMIPGQTSFTPISFSRGVLIGTRHNWNWFTTIFSTVVGTGATWPNGGTGFRGNVDVYILPHARADTASLSPIAHFHIYNAWPTSIAYSDFNSGDNAFMVENMVLAHEGWTLNLANADNLQNAQ